MCEDCLVKVLSSGLRLMHLDRRSGRDERPVDAQDGPGLDPFPFRGLFRLCRVALARSLNVRFYEGAFVKPPHTCLTARWNISSVVHSSLPRHPRTALADRSSLIGNSRSGYIEPPSPLLGLTSIRAGLWPVTTYRIRAERWLIPLLPTRPISNRRSPRRATRGRFGRVDLQFSRCILFGEVHRL